MSMLFRIAERLLNRPLLVHPDKLPLIMAVLQGRIPIGSVDEWRREAEARIDALPDGAQNALRGPFPDASRFEGDFYVRDERGNVTGQLPYRRTSAGVALLPVLGGLINRGFSAEPGSMSKASYEAIKAQLAHAGADDRTKAVLLDLHSPGGEATGAFELAAAVRSVAAKKPVHAVVNGMAASAAYAMASGANRIVTTPTGMVGSIGVVMMHADFSRQLDKEGITPTLIFAGAHKVDGHPFAPMPDGVREDLQREVNAFYDLFVQTVADGRKNLSPAAIRATEARTYLGAEAVAMGLADSVGTFDDVLAELSRASSSMISPSLKGATAMSQETKPAAVAAATTYDQAQLDAAVATARTEATTAGQLAGAAAERTRITGILALPAAGHADLIATLIADGKSTAADAALAILTAEKATRGQQRAAIAGVEAVTGMIDAAPLLARGETLGLTPAAATGPDAWKAEFAADKALQAEFATAERYVTFKTAEASGKVRFLKDRKTA